MGPIGIFDSGIGGLTVAHAIKQKLNHPIIYFGDTAHLPYGDKSEAAIQAYSVRIADFLHKKGCEIIVIACHSASSAAYDLLSEYLRGKATIVNIIDPVVDYILHVSTPRVVGLIGTRRTIFSNVYSRKFTDTPIQLDSLATPLLAPMIEEGFFNKKISMEIIEEYLSQLELNELQQLILGCTHYPLIMDQIIKIIPSHIEVIDPGILAADYIATLTHKNEDLKQQEDIFFVSDYTRSFEESAKVFFKENITLELINLWD